MRSLDRGISFFDVITSIGPRAINARVVAKRGGDKADAIGNIGQDKALGDFPNAFQERLSQRPGDPAADDDHVSFGHVFLRR